MAPSNRLVARSAATNAPTPANSPVPDQQESSTAGGSHAIAPAHIIIAAVTVTLILVASTFGCVMLRRRKQRERAHGGRISPDVNVKFRARPSPKSHSRRKSSHRHSSSKHRDARNSEMSHTLWLENGLPIKEIGGSSSQSTDELTLSGGESSSPPPEYDAALEKAHLAAERF
jgi:hypothetical protein